MPKGLIPHRVHIFFQRIEKEVMLKPLTKQYFFFQRIPRDSVLERGKISQMFMLCEPVWTIKLPIER